MKAKAQGRKRKSDGVCECVDCTSTHSHKFIFIHSIHISLVISKYGSNKRRQKDDIGRML